MPNNNRFGRTYSTKSSGCYTCGACGKKTRATGHGEESCQLCAFCYLEAGLENSYSDTPSDGPEILNEIEAVEKTYGRVSQLGNSLRAKYRTAAKVETDQERFVREMCGE